MARFEVPDGWVVQRYQFALSATLAQDSSGRWFRSFQTIVQRAAAIPAHLGRSPHPVVGVDVGVKADALLVVGTPDGREVERVPAPKSFTAARYECEHCGVTIDRDLDAAINLARLGETRQDEQGPAGSGPVAGRGATPKTRPAAAGTAAGREASTPHRHQLGQTGIASSKGEAA